MTTSRYMPSPIAGTSGADHLCYEITELLPAGGYATAAAAERGWYRACATANRTRRSQGYAAVSRPACRVEVVGAAVVRAEVRS